jgi:hypothetical protein
MADKTLKASIQVDMDAKGVAKGVAATNRELDKLNRTARSTSRSAAISAGIQVAEAGFDVLRTAIGALDKRFTELNAVANKYSATAMNAQISAEMARYDANVRIASALTPGAVAVSRGQSDIAAGEAARIEANAAQVNQSMTAYGLAKENLGVSRDILLEGLGGGLAGLMQMAEGNFSQGLGTAFSSGLNTLDQLVNPTNYALGSGTGSAQGMPYDEAGMMRRQTEAMEKLASGAGN